MEKKQISNEPAFPFDNHQGWSVGATLRDYFAIRAMQAWVQHYGEGNNADIAQWAYRSADAMIEERAK